MNMQSYSIGSRFILTEGLINSILIDFSDKKVVHINNSLKNKILSKQYTENKISKNTFDFSILAGLDITPVNFSSSDHDKYMKLWIDVSGACNLKCKGCYAEKFMKNTDKYFIDDKIIDEAMKYSSCFEGVELIGGEPFVNPNLISILRQLSAKFKTVTLYTNGVVVNKPIIEFCKDNDILIKVSLFGINAKENDSYTRKDGSYVKTIRFIEYCKNKSVNVQISYLITNQCSVKDRTKIIEFLKSFGIDFKIDVERARGVIFDDIKTKNFFKFKSREQYLNSLFNHPCINNKMGVDTNGGLYFCPMERRDIGEIVFGSIENTINLVQKYWKLSMSKRYKDCAMCEYRGLCFDCFVIDPEGLEHPVNCAYDPYNGRYRL